MKKKPLYLFVLGLGALWLAGCSPNVIESGEFYTQWDRQGGCQSGDTTPWGPAVTGEPVSACQFPGQYVWVFYGAKWCTSSNRQTPAFVRFTKEAAENTVYLSVVTGGPKVFTQPTQEDIASWARHYGLPPERVVAELSDYTIPGTNYQPGRVVPQHALIGPQGNTLFRYLGRLSQEEMRDILADFQQGRRTPTLASPST
ncbi:TlpA family protein disulfide reductase [Thiorhodospira sibirica]|uniref:TlpA family protein disulfide reductase n=1 Tax=Thiorhodospira sibirica TaxID=154347 RepID=UPI00022C4C8A|nr:hypothetical protein [Thiorhodospira sibirica]